MTPQPNATRTYPDAGIDQVFDALRSTQAPDGLEQRIAARLQQAAEARTNPAICANISARTTPSFFAVILNAVKQPRTLPGQAKLYATAATAFTLLVTLTILHNHTTTTPSAATTQIAQGSSLVSHRVHQEAGIVTSAISQTAQKTPNAATLESIATTQEPQGFSLGSHSAHKTAGV